MTRLTMGEICARVAALMEVPASSDYATQQIPRYFQDAYRSIWDAQEWPEKIADDFVWNLPANTNQFVLPKQYDGILRCYNQQTGQPIKVRDRSSFADTFYQVGVAYTQDIAFDSITQFAPWPVYQQPSAQGTLSVVTNTTDTSTVIFISGLQALTGSQSLQRVAEQLTLNSTTPVVSTNQYQFIEKFSKTVIPSPGIITLKDAAGNQLGELDQYEKTGDYRRYVIDGTNAVSTALQLTCKKAFIPLLHNFDYPILDMDQAIIQKTLSICWEQRRRADLVSVADGKAQKEIATIAAREVSEEDVVLFVPAMRG